MPGRTTIFRRRQVVSVRSSMIRILQSTNFCLLGSAVLDLFMVGVMPPLVVLPAGKGAVYVGFRGRFLCSPLCVLYIDRTWTYSYGQDFSDQVGKRSEGQLYAPLKWFDGGGGNGY